MKDSSLMIHKKSTKFIYTFVAYTEVAFKIILSSKNFIKEEL